MKSLDASLDILTAILKVLILFSISILQSRKSRYQSQYLDCNPESLDTSLDIKTAILKVLIPVSISRMQLKNPVTGFDSL